MSQPLSRNSAIKLTVAGLLTGILALSSAIWWLRDEMDRRTEALVLRIDRRTEERLAGYVTRETRANDREALNERLFQILTEIRRRR